MAAGELRELHTFALTRTDAFQPYIKVSLISVQEFTCMYLDQLHS